MMAEGKADLPTPAGFNSADAGTCSAQESRKLLLQPLAAEVEAVLPFGVNQVFTLGMSVVITDAEIDAADLVADDTDIGETASQRLGVAGALLDIVLEGSGADAIADIFRAEPSIELESE